MVMTRPACPTSLSNRERLWARELRPNSVPAWWCRRASGVASALTWKSRRYALLAGIAPSERLRRELDQIIVGAGEEPDPIEAIGPTGRSICSAPTC